jgi:hypothetical protein
MRKYDVGVKDDLDVNYPNANIILLGDYSDDVDQSVIAGNSSSSKIGRRTPQDTIH